MALMHIFICMGEWCKLRWLLLQKRKCGIEWSCCWCFPYGADLCMTTVSKVSLGSNKTLLFSLLRAGKRIEESWMWYCIQIDAFKGSRDNCLFIKGFLKWQWTSGSTLCAHFRWFISVHFLWDFPLLYFSFASLFGITWAFIFRICAKGL